MIISRDFENINVIKDTLLIFSFEKKILSTHYEENNGLKKNNIKQGTISYHTSQ